MLGILASHVYESVNLLKCKLCKIPHSTWESKENSG